MGVAVATKDLPWLKFFVSDWRGEPRLRLVSMSAKALWLDMLCLMHCETDRRGALEINGNPMSKADIAMVLGYPADRVSEWIDELEAAGVFCFSNGAISSRKMLREEEQSRVRSECGKRGGRPKGRRNSSTSDIKAKRKQNESKTKAPSDSDSVSVSSSEGSARGDVERVVAHYKTHRPKTRPGSKERDRIRARLADGYTADDICRAIDGCFASRWHQGANDRGRAYNSLELICRDSGRVDAFADLAANPNKPTDWYKGEDWER